MPLQIIEFPISEVEIIGNALINTSLESEYFYLSADSYKGIIPLRFSLASDYSYARKDIGHATVFFATQADYFYNKQIGNKSIISFILNSVYVYIYPKTGHITVKLELESLYTMHGLPLIGKIKLSLFPISDYIFISSLQGKVRITFSICSDYCYLDAYRYTGKVKTYLTMQSNYIYVDSISSKIIARFALNSNTLYKGSDTLFRALIFGAQLKFKLESNINYNQGELQPDDIIPDENDLRCLQSSVDFIYDISKRNCSFEETFVRKWSAPPPIIGNSNMFSGVSVYNNEIYICEGNNYKIQVYNFNGNLLREWGSKAHPDGPFLDCWKNYFYPYGAPIFVDGDNDGKFLGCDNLFIYNNEVFTTDSKTSLIQVFDLYGNFLRKWICYAKGIFVYDNKVFVTTVDADYGCEYLFGLGKIQVSDLNGVPIRNWNLPEVPNEQKLNGTSPYRPAVCIAIYNNRVYVTTTFRANEMFVYDIDGNLLTRWTGCADNYYGCYDMQGDFCIYNDEIFLADLNGHDVIVFDLDGNFLRKFTTIQGGHYPCGIFASEGKLFVTDIYSTYLSIYKIAIDCGLVELFIPITANIRTSDLDIYLTAAIRSILCAPDTFLSATILQDLYAEYRKIILENKITMSEWS
jgi:outer membrane protein assembly factor BamB